MRKHRTMDSIRLLAFVLLAGCFLNISGEVVKTHAVELQNILNEFDTLMKLKTADPNVSDGESETPVVCVMSVNELNEIENALVRDGDRSPVSDNINIQVSPTCTEMDKLQTEILKLKNHFKVLIAEPISSHSYRHLKTNYDAKILQFKNLLVTKMASREHLEVVQKLQNDFQSQQNQIVEVLRKLEAEQKPLNDANVQIAVSQMQQGHLDEAVDAFVKVTDHETQIERIVVSAYGNGDNFENIHRFVVRLPLLSRIIGCKALHEQLKRNNHMSNHRIWMLATAVKDIPSQDGGLIEIVMNDVKTIVRNNNFDGLSGFLNKRRTEGLEVMKYIAPVFVQTIYEETGNSAEKVLAVLKTFTFIPHRLYLINELILMLKSTDRMYGKEMPMIVFELIKLRMDDSPENKSMHKLIEQNLPAELRDLMYNNLCIQNAENEEYLFAGMPANDSQRHVYTAKTQSLNESFFWQVYFTDDGTKILIKNNKYREDLYLIDEGSLDDEHVLRSWIPGSLKGDVKAEFYLDMIGNGKFLIVNNHFGQLLYSPFDGIPNANSNRPVFSKKNDPDNVKVDSKWIVGICRLDVKYAF